MSKEPRLICKCVRLHQWVTLGSRYRAPQWGKSCKKVHLIECSWVQQPYFEIRSFIVIQFDFKNYPVRICALLKLRCDSRFQRAFTACSCVFKVITLIGTNQDNYFENATSCSKRMRKTLVATQLKNIPLLTSLIQPGFSIMANIHEIAKCVFIVFWSFG